MINTVLTVVWPFASAIVISIAELILSRTKKFGVPQASKLKLPKLLRQISQKDKAGVSALSFLVIWTAALLQFLFAMVCVYLVRKGAFVLPGTIEDPVSHLFFASGSIVSDICILYLLRSVKRRAEKAVTIIAVLSYVLIAAELFLFNFNCFKADPYSVTIKGRDLVPDFEYDAENEDENSPIHYMDESVKVRRDVDLLIPNPPSGIYSVTVKFGGAPKEPGKRLKLRLSIQDDNSSYVYRTADVKRVTGMMDASLFVKPYGDVFSLMLSFDEVEQDVRVDSVTLADCNVYGASFIRYLIVFIVAAAAVWIVCLKLYDVEYDPSKISHSILITLVFLLTTGSTFLFYYSKDIKFDKYPLEDTSMIVDIYELAFDSSMKKIPYLDVPVEEELLDMDNPYDISEREAKNITYRWDYAYKDGKYYCYFGMAPVYTFYYPVYLISHRIPNYNAASSIIGTLAVVGVVLAFLACVRMFVPKNNLLAYLLQIPTVAASSLIYLIHSEKYYIACGSAQAGMGFAIFFGILAVRGKKTLARIILFFLSGLSLAICAGSRPSEAILAAVLLPMFFVVLFDKTRKLRFRITEAAVFLVPVISSIVLILMHNYWRFGNILDFGENYQLTVSDINSLKVTPEMLPSAIFYYFLMPFTAIDVFPFFEARGIIANTYEIYRNIEPSVGILSLPFMLLGAVFTPGGFIRAKGKITKGESVSYNGFIVIAVICSVFIAWFNFSRAGVCIRYVTDFAWLLAICFGVILMRRIMRKSGRKTVYGLMCISCILTVVMVFFMVLTNDMGDFYKIYPTLLEKCEDLFIFWH